MEIILIRHALAMDREIFANKFKKDDSQRPLVMKGKKKMFKIAKHLRAWEPKIDLLVTSPYVRARETTQIIKRFYPKTPVLEAAELVPAAPPYAFLNWLHSQSAKVKTIAVIGHEPCLGNFASYCLCGEGEAILTLKKSGAICLEIDALSSLGAGTAQLKWLITPKMFGN
ncbi:MAG: histidine phosphatase family protein [Bdellovibrionota bacterium]